MLFSLGPSNENLHDSLILRAKSMKPYDKEYDDNANNLLFLSR